MITAKVFPKKLIHKLRNMIENLGSHLMENTSYHSTTQLLLVLIASVFLMWLAQFHWKRMHMYSLASKIPGPRGYPIIGVALDWIDWKMEGTEKIFKTGMGYAHQYPELYKFWIGPTLFYGISKPEHMEIILNHPKCLNKAYQYNFLKPLLGNGLLTAPVSIWRKHRKIINPTFNTKLLESFVPVFVEEANKLLVVLDGHVGKNDLDIFEIVTACNVGIVCETAMGVNLDAVKSASRYGEMLDRAMAIALLRFMVVFYQSDLIFKWSKHQKPLYEAINYIEKFVGEVVLRKRKSFEKRMQAIKNGEIVEEDTKWKTFLDQLIRLSYDGSKFTDDELRHEVNTFMAAGSDTTAATMCFCFITMGMHPEIQDKLYDEVIAVIGEDRDVTAKDLPHLQYMERFIKETLRLFPIGGVFLRNAETDINLGDAVLAGNSTLFICPIYTHINPKYWKDPLKFDPDRFLPEEVAKRHPYSYLPFSEGPRACIGSRYAFMSMKSILATFIRKFIAKTEYKTIEEVELKLNLLLRPVHGFKVTIESRK